MKNTRTQSVFQSHCCFLERLRKLKPCFTKPRVKNETITLPHEDAPLKIIRSCWNVWICSLMGIFFSLFHCLFSFFLDLQLNKQFSVFPSAAAPTPSLGNVAASDLSFFDAYAPASTPAQNQVMHSASEDFSISQV